jgi:hypothetical protein
VCVAAAAGLAVSLAPPAHAADKRAGSVVVVAPDFATPLKGGNGNTVYSLNVPKGAACQGDSATDNYRVQSFLIPAGTDVGSVTFNNFKPHTTDANALFATSTNPFWDSFTDKASTPGGGGPIIDIPPMSFKVFEPPFLLKPHTYQIGIACTLYAKVTRYWSTLVVVKRDLNDKPAQIRWTVVNAPAAQGPPIGKYVAYVVIGLVIVGILYVILKPSKRDLAEAAAERVKV